MDSAQNLKDLQAVPAVVKVADKELVIRPIRFGQLHHVVEQLGPALADLAAPDISMEDLLLRHTRRLLPLVELLTGADRKWLEQLDLADTATLVTALIEANTDFFVNRMAPALESATSRISGRLSSLKAPAPTTASAASAGPTPPSG